MRWAFISIVGLSLTGCTSLVKEPYYSFKTSGKPGAAKISKDSDGRPIGFRYKQSWGDHQSVWIKVLNRGEPNIYAIGVVLPIIPDLAFEEPKNKIDKSKNIEIQYFAYSHPPFTAAVKALPENPPIALPNGTILKPVNTKPCGKENEICRVFVYGATVETVPEFTFLETTTELVDGNTLKTPKMEFYFRDRLELIYHRGP